VRIRGRLDLERAVLAPAGTVDRERRASDLAGEPLEGLPIFDGNYLPSEGGKAWVGL